jgi:hypothetical protein
MSASNVIPFPDPADSPLRGAAREAAIRAYRDGVARLADDAVAKAFNEACRLPGCGELAIADAVPLFVQAFRTEVSRFGL